MSSNKNRDIKTIKTININKKITPNYANISTNSNESMVIKTNNNYHKSTTPNFRQKNSLNIFKHKNRVQSAHLQNKANQISLISKSTLAVEKKTINKFYNYFNYNNFFNIDNKENKENKQNQVSLIFNNSILNNYYKNKCTKLNNYFLKLTKFHNPHHNYFRIVKNEKNILKELISQTKNNFNNNYKIIYANPDSKKRNHILKCFNKIKENKTKNIDSKNSIEIIATKALFKQYKNNCKVENEKISINRNIIFPSSFNMKTFVNKTKKIKLRSVKIANEITKQNIKTIPIKNKEGIYKSVLYRNKLIQNNGDDFFKTLPKNNRNESNDIYLDYSKSSSIESLIDKNKV